MQLLYCPLTVPHLRLGWSAGIAGTIGCHCTSRARGNRVGSSNTRSEWKRVLGTVSTWPSSCSDTLCFNLSEHMEQRNVQCMVHMISFHLALRLYRKKYLALCLAHAEKTVGGRITFTSASGQGVLLFGQGLLQT